MECTFREESATRAPTLSNETLKVGIKLLSQLCVGGKSFSLLRPQSVAFDKKFVARGLREMVDRAGQ